MKFNIAKKLLTVVPILCLAAVLITACGGGMKNNLKFSISFPESVSQEALDGRVLLMIAKDDSREPRFQVSPGPSAQPFFGINVDGLQPNQAAVIDGSVFGFPVESLNDIPAGEYWVQALLHKYETFNRSDGHTVKLPMDQGEGQHWNISPGNLYSTPQKLKIDPAKKSTIALSLDNVIDPIPEPADTKYIKHVKIQSKLLTEFWGRPMFLGAHVLIPEGFDEHPNARYPLVVNHGHFPHDFGGFRTEPPDPDLEPDYSARFNWEGYNRTQQEYAYKFYKYWIAPKTPRMLIIEIQHPTPYYDDSYAVNSANNGPYGDAINEELIPYIEEKFRGIGEGWARFMYGGSTGGWESLGVQIFYPDFYNGCYAACPDPIDFRAYTQVNIYEDENAYYYPSDWKKTERPVNRNYLGRINFTVRDWNLKEYVVGDNTRSGDQFHVWESVFSPCGDNGYPKPIWDPLTGQIDHEVAKYWQENYDLSYILRRDWPKIGEKLKGKIHIYCGDMDNYYLNNAVYLVEEFLESTTDPYYEGEVDYGDRAEHCWNGDHSQPNAISRLRYHQMFAPKMVKQMLKTAPRGADLKSWRY